MAFACDFSTANSIKTVTITDPDQPAYIDIIYTPSGLGKSSGILNIVNYALQETYNALLSGYGSYDFSIHGEYSLFEPDPNNLALNFQQPVVGTARIGKVKVLNGSSRDRYISDFNISMSINYGPDGTFTARKLTEGNIIKAGEYAEFEITYIPSSLQQVWYMGFLRFKYGDSESDMNNTFSLKLTGTVRAS